jgi:phospholipid-binding lipoprotein MlaA
VNNFHRIIVSAFLLPGLLACASTRVSEKSPDDPFESVNRPIYTFNRTLDKYLIKPLAVGYRMVLPNMVRTGITNFFANIDDITVAANKVLQLEIEQAVQVSARFLVNSTAGVGGLVDVASHTGLEKQRADFGLTLARWGIKESPYIVIPIFGPSTLRDGVGLLADFLMSPYPYIPDEIGYAVFVIDLLNIRANLLDEEYYFDYAAMDPYTFMRDFYMQRRRAQIRDMNGESKGGDWDDGQTWDDWKTEPATSKSATPVAPAP